MISGGAAVMRTMSPSYAHLLHLTDEIGLFEHADADDPRPEHGYCVDDVARGLIVVVREPHQTPEVVRLADLYLRFLVEAIAPDGRAHNRRDTSGRWTDDPGVGDWWGRALWGLGVTVTEAPLAAHRDVALVAFHRLAARRSQDVRAMAFAALSAGELVLAGRDDAQVLSLLTDAIRHIPTEPVAGWGWPEERLRYANGALAEAVIVGGMSLSDDGLVRTGIRMLEALLEIETRDGRISVTGCSGRGPGDRSPLFDQQPIEVAALADAAFRAFGATGDARWLDTVRSCWSWFLGDNDSEIPMVDLDTGAGFDGLIPDGRNVNRGAESTLAALSTWQRFTSIDRIGISP